MKKTEIKKEDKPTFIYRDGMTADKEYVQWLHEVKSRYRQSQVKAAVRVNTAMLEFYWSMGHDIVAMQAETKWGSGFFNQLSLDMKAEFPGEKGFSSANLRYMKRWFEFYYQGVANLHQADEEIVQQSAEKIKSSILQRPVEELRTAIRQRVVDELGHQAGDEIVQQPVEELQMPDCFGQLFEIHKEDEE